MEQEIKEPTDEELWFSLIGIFESGDSYFAEGHDLIYEWEPGWDQQPTDRAQQDEAAMWRADPVHGEEFSELTDTSQMVLFTVVRVRVRLGL